MEYNTERNKLIIPEYGRNIQKMIEYAIATEDRNERNKIAKTIVNVMGQLNPQYRDVADFKHKLWDHLFIISDFKLEVDSPYPIPSALSFQTKPQKVAYPSNQIQFKHYGKNVELMIDEIKKLEEGPRKEAMVSIIANFMKMAYLNWNRDTVNDELILDHLKLLSKGGLSLGENARLSHTNDILAKTVTKKPVITNKGKGFKPKNGNNPSINKGRKGRAD
jgi:hypothetical protein